MLDINQPPQWISPWQFHCDFLRYPEDLVIVPLPNGCVIWMAVLPPRKVSRDKVPRPKGCVMIVAPSERLVNVPFPNLVVMLVSPASTTIQMAKAITVKKNFINHPFFPEIL